MQVLEALDPKLVGVQASEDSAIAAGTRLIVVVGEMPPKAALMVALWLLLMVPVVAPNVEEIAPLTTLTEAGTDSAALLLERRTEAPPAGAAWLRLIVHVLVAFGPRLVGAQVRDAAVVGGCGFELLLRSTA